jgi:hypothetical protein
MLRQVGEVVGPQPGAEHCPSQYEVDANRDEIKAIDK